MSSCDYVGLFMDFNIYKSFEITEDNIVVPKFIGIYYGGNHFPFQCSTLEELVTKIVKYEYLNNPYYECLLYNLTKDIKNEKEGD